ncbi:MAG TPA: heme-binding protein [Acidimicrobiia bacterium]|nr:heme-binding protein [Acidimicrobiia bacterium]
MPLTRIRATLDTVAVDTVLGAAEKHAVEHGYRVAIAVVDHGGNLLALRRTEDTQIASSQVAIDKARTAAIFVRPSRDIEEQVSSGRLGALALHGAAALTGGIPIVVDGEVVGAIGTSGETPLEDESVSLAGAAAAFARRDVPALTFASARLAAEAAGAEAARRAVAPVVAIVDAGGVLVYLHRPDAAQVASVGVATDKARTAAIYRRPSKDFEEQASNGRPSALHLAGSVPLQGGLPLEIDGVVVGAIGVSGASSADEDQELSRLGQSAFVAAVTSTPRATRIGADEMTDAFAVGRLVVATAEYQVDAGRRTGPGAPELHDAITDVMYVVEGNATVITGPVCTGQVHSLAPGDVLVIPAGVTHTFTEVTDPFRYLVVKVAS